MARTKKIIGINVINQQIEEAQDAVIKAKKKYDDATDHLKALLDKKKEPQTAELMEAVLKSQHSYEDILRYINLDNSEEVLKKIYRLYHKNKMQAVLGLLFLEVHSIRLHRIVPMNGFHLHRISMKKYCNPIYIML